jgi:hypothetical protein
MHAAFAFAGGLLLTLSGVGSAPADEPADEPTDQRTVVQPAADEPSVDERFFENRIRPVLVEHCYECHSGSSSPLQGGLRVDFQGGLLTGGDSGPAVVPGDLEASLLLKALAFQEFEMPPTGKLPDSVLADFSRWVRGGAPDPRSEAPVGNGGPRVDFEAASQWWAFQPLSHPVPPVGQSNSPDVEANSLREAHASAGWERAGLHAPRGPVDAFIDAGMQTAGLVAAPDADRATWLRRVAFDLTGLPPEPELLEAFIQDQRPDAYERVIDRLLAAPAYGERRGRFWLDLARYADSNGADENHTYPVAWRYRDYVVEAFNEDTAYDRFLHEQLAGDLLPAEDEQQRRRLLTATGFLVIGPKMLAEQDKPKLVADIVDEQIDALGQSLLAMTFGCARCHDHKFDPVVARDYYALAGIFHSTKSMAHLEFVSQWNERELPDAQLEAQIAAHRQQVEAAKAELAALSAATPEAERTESQQQELARAKARVEELEKAQPALPKAMAADEAPLKTVPVHIRGNHLQLGPEPVPRAVPVVFQRTVPAVEFPEQQSGRLQLAQWLTAPEHPLTSRVIVNRLWQWYFGEGIVRSASNFGLTGELPSHPELLDWLARDLTTHGWSLKRQQRALLLSATYRRSSRSAEFNQENLTLDPENRYFSRQNRRRLELEPLRDALLAVGGNLDRRLGGQAESIYGDRYEETGQAKGVHDALRRAIYLPVNRAALHELFGTFDYVESGVSVGRRSSTVVPHQALFFMNSPLVIQQARVLSQRVRAAAASDPARIDVAIRICFGRPATEAEVTAASQFLASRRDAGAAASPAEDQPESAEDQPPPPEDAADRAWHRLCMALLASSEFIVID